MLIYLLLILAISLLFIYSKARATTDWMLAIAAS
jgi:hypothetical protein